ncbi:MAG: 30S ribosomal protein S20 [Acholeplasmatales bacterium]|jgi:ribosomal protein S20|nr:30S ribosomal protein S20 [Acholeplasmatales bacterium]MDD7395234.1 30S ribosomal protein S20 [Acholeplasmatales bacterium]MDY4016521.1 30S ribosomal protein S20 [Bacilli bacterium]CDD21994.1 30S ribosomal protein S20 [Firmicutes bacterium CAG:313]HCX08640.1 30S ribosomal protein S20 [Acholeplasmatales bacterium]
MANIKQQKKRDITNNKKRLLNNSFASSLKTAVKAFEAAVVAGDKAKAQEAFNFACKKIDKAVTKGLHHKNYAARQKSRLAKALNAMA